MVNRMKTYCPSYSITLLKTQTFSKVISDRNICNVNPIKYDQFICEMSSDARMVITGKINDHHTSKE